jgi:hypothetical protein
MLGRWAIGKQGLTMRGCRVTLVLVETVLRVSAMQFLHQCIASHLCQYGCGADCGTQIVTADQRLERSGTACGHRWLLIAVYPQVVRHLPQAVYGPVHCKQGRLQDIQAIDLLRRGHAYRPVAGRPADFERKLIAPGSAELLGITDARNELIITQQHDRCDDRARQGAPSGFVNSAYQQQLSSPAAACKAAQANPYLCPPDL